MRMWLLGGLVAIGSAGVVACGGPEIEEDVGTVVAAHKNDDGKNQCKEEEREKHCEEIGDGQNITQVFIDLPGCFDERDVEKVVVFDRDNDVVRVYSGRELKRNGGPCKEIERDFWFPLQGNQDEAKVCVFFEDDVKKIPKDIAISWKAGGTCFPDRGVDDDDCKECDRKDNDECKDKNGRRKDHCKDDGKDDGKHDDDGKDGHGGKYRWDEGRNIDGWDEKDDYKRR